VSEECVDDAYEDNDGDGVENDSYTTPEAIVPGSYDMTMCMADADWYSIMVNNGETLRATLTDLAETEIMDLGLFALEIDPAYALCYVSENNYLECEYANTEDHPVDFLISVRDYNQQAEGDYTLTVETIAFEQMAYSVYRDGEMLTDGVLSTDYMDDSVVPGSGAEHCYTVTASLSGATGSHSDPPACVQMEFVEPPAAPYDFAAEGGWYDESPMVTWTWAYDYPECANTLNVGMLDSYGDGWNGNTLVIDGGALGVTTLEPETGNPEEWAEICLENGTYTVTCDGGSWQSEIAWQIVDDAGAILLNGGSPYSGELVLDNGRDEQGISHFKLSDGQNQSDVTSRDIAFELCFEYFGTPYCYQTDQLGMLITGFTEGDEVCGVVAAVENGWYSEEVGPECAIAGPTLSVCVR